tara:strand:- start:336 stop:755 length:420 start_codon:yes stop_codon:yes gene_type:complete
MTKLWDTLKNKVKTLRKLSKEFPDKTYRQLEKYRDADRQEEAQQILVQQENEELKEDQFKETWKDKYDLEHRLRQEAEGEMSILKTISVHSSPEMRDANKKIEEQQKEIDRIKKENNKLYNRIAALTDADLQKARESGL